MLRKQILNFSSFFLQKFLGISLGLGCIETCGVSSDVIWNKFHVSHWNSFLPFFLLGRVYTETCVIDTRSHFTTMYVVKWWHALETCVVWNKCHHFTTYIVVKRDTCVNDTSFGINMALANVWHWTYFKWHLMPPTHFNVTEALY